ncbi:MAG: DNA alkylation repair protein [Bacteroidetes bacterium]|nr:DNA alkylation repair protein [Bacteroidota bacterium]
MQTARELLSILISETNPVNREGMARFGINPAGTLGISIPRLRELARSNKRNHEAALELYQSGYHEARILASMMAEPKRMTQELMQDWVTCFDSWDVCDQVCLNAFATSPDRWLVPFSWMEDDREFIRRAGFVMIAVLAVKDLKAPDDGFIRSLPYCRTYATDPRNFVKKAISWALRQTGRKRSALVPSIIQLAGDLLASNDPTSRWIGRDVRNYLLPD